jgi:hypothetical protein
MPGVNMCCPTPEDLTHDSSLNILQGQSGKFLGEGLEVRNVVRSARLSVVGGGFTHDEGWGGAEVLAIARGQVDASAAKTDQGESRYLMMRLLLIRRNSSRRVFSRFNVIP